MPIPPAGLLRCAASPLGELIHKPQYATWRLTEQALILPSNQRMTNRDGSNNPVMNDVSLLQRSGRNLNPAGLDGPISPEEPALARLWDGSELIGMMTVFDVSAGQIDLALDDGSSRRLALTEFRSLTLTNPVDHLQNAESFRRHGINFELMPAPRPFAIELNDKQIIAGELRGYTADMGGVGIYLVGDGSVTLRLFVPATGIANFTVGERVGTLLLMRGELTRDGLELALERQRTLRHQQLGSLLLERSLVTRTQLEDALQRQAQKPVRPLGEVLVEMGMLTRRQLDEALDEQRRNRRRPLGEILIEQQLVDEAVLHNVLAQKLGIPFVDLSKYALDPNWPDLAAYPLCRQFEMIPLYRAGDKVTIALENPMDLERLREIAFALGCPVIPVLASGADIQAVLERHPERRLYESLEDSVGDQSRFPTPDATSDDAQNLVSKLAGEMSRNNDPLPASASVTGDSTLVRLVNKIILDAHQSRVSDIHIEPGNGRERLRVRFRRDGGLYEYLALSSRFRAAIVSRLKIMANLDISEHRMAQDGKIDMKRYAGVDLELRVAVVPTHNGVEAVVIRLLTAVKPIPLEEIGLAQETLKRLRTLADKPHGLIAVCGPTGSGKTTTLHSLLGYLNTPNAKIWTAEDPIEITQPGLNQVQMHSSIGWTFATALRAFLRADPDVIMVGEVRDVETARIVVEASLTGHLVLTTLHTNSAAESATRLIDIGIDPFNFADALLGVLGQRLSRRICSRCRKLVPGAESTLRDLADEYCDGSALPPKSMLVKWRELYAVDGTIHLAQPTGCRACNNSGFSGRLAIYELLVASPGVKRVLLRRGTAEEIQTQAIAEGMRTLKQDGIEKVLQGVTTIEQVRAVAT